MGGAHQPLACEPLLLVDPHKDILTVVRYADVQDVRTCSSLSLSPGNDLRGVCVADFILVTRSLSAMKVDTVGRSIYFPPLVARVDRAHMHCPIMTPGPARGSTDA